MLCIYKRVSSLWLSWLIAVWSTRNCEIVYRILILIFNNDHQLTISGKRKILTQMNIRGVWKILPESFSCSFQLICVLIRYCTNVHFELGNNCGVYMKNPAAGVTWFQYSWTRTFCTVICIFTLLYSVILIFKR